MSSLKPARTFTARSPGARVELHAVAPERLELRLADGPDEVHRRAIARLEYKKHR